MNSDSTPWDETPVGQFYDAVSQGNSERVRAHLSHGMSANVLNEDGDGLLRRTAELGHVQVARLLIEYGANINYQDDDGYTPLLVAADEGNLEMVELLLDAGADLSVLGGTDAGTALHKAARDQNAGLVKLLLDRGADPNAEDMDGTTAIDLQRFFASRRPQNLTAKILELLQKAGAIG